MHAACSLFLLLVVGIARSSVSAEQSHELLKRQSSRTSSELFSDRMKIILGKHIIRSMEELVGLLEDEADGRYSSHDYVSKNNNALLEELEELSVFSKALSLNAAYEIVKPWTMVAFEYQEIMYNEIARMNANNVSGAVVECGVWAGGSSMMMMYSQIRSGSTDRNFWLYDTYEGHVAPDVTKDAEADYNMWKAVTQADEATRAPDSGIEAVDNKCVACFSVGSEKKKRTSEGWNKSQSFGVN